MKSIFTITLSLLLALPFMGYAQRYKNKDVALISFSVSINDDVKAYLDKFESQFPNTANTKSDKIIALIKDQAWAALADSLQEGVGMSVLPVTTFGNRSNYDEYKYPNIGISKAQQIGYSKLFIKIDLAISAEPPLNQPNFKAKPSTVPTAKPKEGEVMPFVSVTLSCFSNNGIIPIGKFTGTAQASTIWKDGNSSILDGLVNADAKTDQSTIMSLITHCIHDAVKNMKVK